MTGGTLDATGGGGSPLVTVTYAAAAALKAGATIVPGQRYLMTGCDTALYGGTDVLVLGATTTSFAIEGYGIFYNPKYNQALTGFGIWHSGIAVPTAGVTQYIYGGKLWTSATGVVGTATDIYTLSAAWTAVSFNSTDYNVVIDDIDFDFDSVAGVSSNNGCIIGREDRAGNTIATSYQQILDLTTTYNPIKCFQWGNDYVQSTDIGVGNNDIEASYLECINFRGKNILRNKVSGRTKIYSNTFTAGTTEFADNIFFTGAELYSNTFTQCSSNYMDGSAKVYSNTITNFTGNEVSSGSLVYSNTSCTNFTNCILKGGSDVYSNTVTNIQSCVAEGGSPIYSNSGTTISSLSLSDASSFDRNTNINSVGALNMSTGSVISQNSCSLQISQATLSGLAQIQLNSGSARLTIQLLFSDSGRINSNVCNTTNTLLEIINLQSNSGIESNTFNEAYIASCRLTDTSFITGTTLTGDGGGTTSNITGAILVNGSNITGSSFTGGGDAVFNIYANSSDVTFTAGGSFGNCFFYNKNVSTTSAQNGKTFGLSTAAFINVLAITHNPADTTAYYFGSNPKAPSTTAAINKIYPRKACLITGANIYVYAATVAGTNENVSVYIRVNNTTDHLIQTVGVGAAERVFSNTAMTIELAATDYFEIKVIPPAWATNPTGVTYGGTVTVQTLN
jgi:hypothetical protein